MGIILDLVRYIWIYPGPKQKQWNALLCTEVPHLGTLYHMNNNSVPHWADSNGFWQTRGIERYTTSIILLNHMGKTLIEAQRMCISIMSCILQVHSPFCRPKIVSSMNPIVYWRGWLLRTSHQRNKLKNWLLMNKCRMFHLDNYLAFSKKNHSLAL